MVLFLVTQLNLPDELVALRIGERGETDLTLCQVAAVSCEGFLPPQAMQGAGSVTRSSSACARKRQGFAVEAKGRRSWERSQGSAEKGHF